MEKWAAMEVAIGFLFVVLFSGGVGSSEAAVYKVGDSTGWTILGNPNYAAWASKKTFHVGDTVVFEYNKQFHNVLEVTKDNLKGCNASSPLASYKTGNDSITLNHTGHYYFLCGTPGHCAAGQKVDIDVTKSSSAAPSPAPSAAPSATPSTAPSTSISTAGAATGFSATPSKAPSPAPDAAALVVPDMLPLISALLFFAAVWWPSYALI